MNRISTTIDLAAEHRLGLADYMRVGFIQTRVPDHAWPLDHDTPPRMTRLYAERAWQEVKKGFRNLLDDGRHPDIIVLPELTIPCGYTRSLQNLCKALGAVVVAGLDFELVQNRGVRNRAVVLVPQGWPDTQVKPKTCRRVPFGKCFFSQDELDYFGSKGYTPLPDPAMYIFNAGRFGQIGVAICSDFFDIERFVIYKGLIHHMLVISHNRDSNSYHFLAEAIARLVFCNVIICNTGAYGDSFAFSPFEKDYKRIVYRHQGKDLFNTQVVELPVAALDMAQRGKDSEPKTFKARPPGYPEQT